MDFAAQDEVRGLGRNVVERVVGVDEAPVFRRGAVVVEGVVCLEGGGVEIEPLAFTAVEVLIKGKFTYV